MKSLQSSLLYLSSFLNCQKRSKACNNKAEVCFNLGWQAMSFLKESLHESTTVYHSGIECIKRQIKDLKGENASCKTKMAALQNELNIQKESNAAAQKSKSTLESEKLALIEDLQETEANFQKVIWRNIFMILSSNDYKCSFILNILHN